jgi:hypothetical protein
MPLVNRVPLANCSEDLYCPYEYGAVGNDLALDTAGVQGAITAAGVAGGGVVVIPKNTFLVSGLVMSYPNVALVGEGAGAVLLGTTDEVSLMLAVSGANCEIHGVAFKGQMLTTPLLSNQASNEAIHLLSGASNTIITQCRFGGLSVASAFNVCIRGHAGVSNPQITNNYFDRIIGLLPGYGYHIQLADVSGGLISGNTMTMPPTQGRHHVYLSATTSDVLVSSNTMTGGVESMITVFATGTASVSNTITTNNLDCLGGGAGTTSGAIELVGLVNSCAVQGNTITASGAYGIKFEGDGTAENCTDNAMVGNIIIGSTLAGIRILGSERALIEANKVIDCASRGIQLKTATLSTCADATIVGNQVSGTLHKYALDLDTAGDGIHVVGNRFEIGYTDYYNGITTNHTFGANFPTGDNLVATADPVVTDDVSAGYTVGSTWINVTSDKAFVCVDETAGAAVWVETTAGASGGDPDQNLFATVTGDTGSFTADGVANTLEVLGGSGLSTVVTDAAGTTTVTVELGKLLMYTAKTASYTLTEADSGGYFTNEGAGGITTFTLPTTPAVGVHYYVSDADNEFWSIDAPAGATINLNGTVGAASGMINAADSGDWCHIVATSSTTWVVLERSAGVSV